MDLVDHEALVWANVGRHPLGASCVGKNKSEALAAKLGADFPHSTFQAHATGASSLIADSPKILLDSRLVVSAMG